MWKVWILYFSVHFSSHVIPIRQCEQCLCAKIQKITEALLEMATSSCSISPANNVITSAQNHVTRTHPFIHKRALSKTYSKNLFSQPMMPFQHACGALRRRTALLLLAPICFSGMLPFICFPPFFFFFFKARIQKDKDRRIDGGGSKEKHLEKKGGCLWHSNWTVKWGWSERSRKLKSCNVSTTVSGPSTRCR